MIKFAVLLAVVVLSACVEPSQTTIAGPSGQAINTAKCNQSPEKCMKKAAETCKGPYQVVDSHSKSGGLVADVIPGPVTWYSMSYQCGRSDGRMPTFPFRGQTYQAPQMTAAPKPTTTNCSKFGNSVSCTSY